MPNNGSGNAKTWVLPDAITKRINAAASKIPPAERVKMLSHLVFTKLFFKDEMHQSVGAFELRSIPDQVVTFERMNDVFRQGAVAQGFRLVF